MMAAGLASGAARIPPRLARRIDRLARRAHAFHRFAHHPLCAAYAPEVVPLGRRVRVCRGCALLAAGAAAGVLAGALLPPAAPPTLAAAAMALVLLGFGSVLPGSPGPRPRKLPKLATRFLPMALAAALVVLGFRAWSPAGLGAALAATATFALALLAYRRRGPDRRACVGCPEAPASASCSGFAPMARRERAFRRRAARWLSG